MKASRILPSAQIEAQKLNERAKEIQAGAEAEAHDEADNGMDKAKTKRGRVKTTPTGWMLERRR